MASILPLLLLLLLLLQLLTFLSSSISSSTLLNSTSALFSSGFFAMSLTLEAAAPSLFPSPSSPSTLFSPPDSSFSSFGQPPISLLRFHVSPRHLSPSSLRSLPFSSRLPSLSPIHLTITTSLSSISINGVSVNGTPLFDDGSLVVYATSDFLDPAFDISSFLSPVNQIQNPKFDCRFHEVHHQRPFAGASEKLTTSGYSAMAAFLDLQLHWGTLELTVFAPADGIYQGNFTEQVETFRRHAVPCRLKGEDLAGLGAGTLLLTFLEGFAIGIERSDGRMLFNGVEVAELDLYGDDLVAVHGVHEVLRPLGSSLDFGS